MREEHDFLGSVELPDAALYGIHSVRARDNFPDTTPFHKEWFRALGTVKQACYETYRKFMEAACAAFGREVLPIPLIESDILDAMIETAGEIAQGKHFDHFIVPAISGGAGTSINMNVNEIIANGALARSGKHPGCYDLIDPIEHANIFQSTNDVIPTSLKLAIMNLLETLEKRINGLRESMETLEKQHRNTLRVGYTQMQEAVPTSFGKLFSAYNDALSRDWWRVSKCFERIKVINLGGSAVGTGITVPRFFIFEVVPVLRALSGMPVTRSENLSDATANMDSYVEIHAVIKAHAVNLEKIASDIRLLAADVSRDSGLSIPARQMGSTIMPGKVNPVITEFAISACHRVYANDVLITSLSAQGCLDLNAYIPLIGHSLIESIKLLSAADQSLTENMVEGIHIDSGAAESRLLLSPSVTTALVPYIGYNSAAKLSAMMKEKRINIIEANERLNVIDSGHLREILTPHNLLRLGFSLKEIQEERERFSGEHHE